MILPERNARPIRLSPEALAQRLLKSVNLEVTTMSCKPSCGGRRRCDGATMKKCFMSSSSPSFARPAADYTTLLLANLLHPPQAFLPGQPPCDGKRGSH